MPRSDISPLSLLMQRVDATADGAPARDTVPTGFFSLDKLLGGGLRRGDLVVLGGDVGSGKSALALAIALRVRRAGRPAAFYTSEMGLERVLERVLAIEGRARVDEIRQGTLTDESRAKVGAAALRLRDELPVIDRLPPAGMSELGVWLAGLEGIELAVVDSLQALATGRGAEGEELADAVREAKRLAAERNIALLLTAQLPMLLPDRRGARPALDDFGALGAVKFHADVVLGLYREEMYQPGAGAEGATELALLKNRNGALGYVDLYFYKQWLRFEDMVDPEE